ncbi:VanZ family protein [Egicoccus sp. AB-alg6-2]|uniref:VanZ family protein n=1 Tax=Egicoccus sp. AB-alg6-2 TaxID=3242692 RepID=UPI00359E8696
MFGPIDVVAAAAAAVPVGLLVGLVVWRRRRAAHRATRDAWIDGALVGWLVAVGVATLSPLGEFGQLTPAPEVVLDPFARLPGAPAEYAVVNLLLLAPVGLLLVLRGLRANLLRAVLFGAVTSLTVEVLQLFHPGRGTNVDDLILNTVGVVLGAVLGLLLRPLRPSLRHRSGGRPRRERVDGRREP